MLQKKSILIPKGKKVILFDGVCNVCNGFVRFILKRDSKGLFFFASLQSEVGQQLLAINNVKVANLSTVVLIDGDTVFTHSDVVLIVGKYLGGIYQFIYLFKILPTNFRNFLYDWFAKNRYRFFGKKDVCMMPKPEWHSRFLDVM